MDVAEGRFHIAAHVLGLVELGFLGQIADLDTGLGLGLALDLGIDSGHDAPQAGLARAVEPEYPDLGARKKDREMSRRMTQLGRHHLADPVHGEDVLRHSC